MQLALRHLGFFLAHVLRRFDQDRCLQIASSLTFTTLLALVPLITTQEVAELPGLGQIARRALLTGHEAQRLVQRMVGRGWVARTAGDRYSLACDADKLLVADVYREFALGGSGSVGAEKNEAVKVLLDELAARAGDVLNSSRRQLLDSQTVPIR